MAATSSGTQDPSARHALDRIGEKVHDQVKNDAEKYKKALTGLLSQAPILGERAYTTDTCALVKQYYEHLNGDATNSDPCGNASVSEKRFSKERVTEYDNKKMKCSNGDACAPYRRLSLCKKNMEKIPTSMTKHDLLLDVCLAAKYEGDSIKTHYPKYRATYGDVGSTMCTMLARSFADIGDIIRGRDLYRGNKQEKEKRGELESKLNDIFKKIHSEVTNGEIEARYKDDTANYYQLREDWWEANRETVWEALTCEAPYDSQYFRATCGDNEKNATRAPSHCRCEKKSGGKPGKSETAQVPTYFDYVPQYLRWFEEWAEEFCRKKKKYVDIVKTYCRGEYDGKKRYCSRNGCDCTKTVRAKGKLRYGNRCTDCLYACNPYVHWIEKQKEQFLKQKEQFDKQKKKYADEIKKYTKVASSSSGGSRTKGGAGGTSTTNYDGYESKFYKKLKDDGNYSDVNKFLEKLSDEDVCKKITDEKEGTIHFEKVNSGSASGDGDGSNKTFYHSEYCQPCPYCGMKRTSKGSNEWEKKNDQCKSGKLYEPIKPEEGTKIEILKSGENRDDIEKKLNAFCQEQNRSVGSSSGGRGGRGDSGTSGSGSQKLYEEWKCYEAKHVKKVKDDKNEEEEDEDEEDKEEVEKAGGLCILKKEKKEVEETNSQKEPDEIQKTYNDFFYYWVAHMLKDSIYWRTKKLDKCINNTNGKQTKCKKGCNNDCECFKNWIDKKEKEWDAIKKQFRKQKGFDSEGENGISVGGGLGMTADVVLEMALELEFANENSTEDAKNNVSAEEAEEIKHLRDIIKKKNQGTPGGSGTGGSPAGKKKTLMDELIEYERGEANNCLKTHNDNECPQRPAGGPGAGDPGGGAGRADLGRTAGGHTPGPAEESDEDEDHDEDNDDDQDDVDAPEEASEAENPDEEEENVNQEDTAAVVDQETKVEETKEEGKPPCQIVKELFNDTTTLQKACSTKYGPKAPTSWKCVSSGVTTTGKSGAESPTTSGATTERVRGKRSTPETATSSSGNTTGSGKDGAICVPPRRRKLYIQKLHDWAEKYTGNTEASGSQETSGTSSTSGKESSQSEKLRTAFIESAAIETFFLWHRYKKEKEIEKKEKQQLVIDTSQLGKEPQEELEESGEIPDGFLRLMFYTLGDYRDILVRGGHKTNGVDTNNDKTNIVLLASENKQEMEKIQQEIDKILKQSGNNKGTSGSTQQTEREKWWELHGPDIWKGMICALTYNTDSGTKETPPKQIDDTGKLLAKIKDKDGEYHYDQVVLKEENETGARSGSSLSGVDSTINNPKLSDFVLRPTYFRYLEEWGETFCRQRTRMLDKIKVDCEVEENDRGKKQKIQKYSEDGEQCDRRDTSNEGLFAELDKPSCAKHCSSYKKWIKTKKNEFEKQQKAYKEQRTNYTIKNEGAESTDHDKKFCGTLEENAAEFLQKLGSCKKDELDFTNPNETFVPADNCKPCSQFRVKSEKCNCGSSANGKNCKDKTAITKEDIKNMNKDTEINMLVSDDSATGFPQYLNEACKTSGIFKGIRKDVWTCGKVCGLDVCGLKNANGKNYDQIILIRALFKRWVEYFLEDYKKIKHKISHCINNGNGSICTSDCGKKCNCVDTWITEKRKEWENIKNRYVSKNESENADSLNTLTNFLETMIPKIAAANDKKKFYAKLDKLEVSLGCNCPDNSAKNGAEDGKESDIIDCMLNKLQRKAKNCPGKPSGESPPNCGENPITPPDDDEPLEEENPDPNQKGKQHPSFCNIEDTTEAEDESDCKTDAPQPDVKEEEEEKEEEKDKGDEKEEKEPRPLPPAPSAPKKPAPKQPKQRRIKPRHALDHPLLKPALMSSTIMWSIGIGFAAFTYFYLKKKMKKMKKRKKKFIKIKKKKKKKRERF